MLAAPPAYVIDARLRPATHDVAGVITIRYVNRSARPLDAVWLQLYPNTFRPGSDYQRLAGARYTLDTFYPNGRDPGGIDLRDVRVDGLPVTTRFADTGYARVALPSTLAPGSGIELKLGFTTHVPEVFDRFGRVGDDYTLGYWYPRMAVLGEKGWDLTLRTTPLQEFHDEHGDVDVRLTLPRGFAVGGTGERVADGLAENPAERRVRFVAHDVRTACVVAGPGWREVADTQDGVTVHVLAHADEAAAVPRIASETHEMVRFYGELVGPYPYRDLTVVSSDALPVGGIEMPQVVLNSRLLTRMAALAEGRAEVGYTALNAHEVAHQWFFGIIGNDEAHDAWLDESFASYLAMRYLERPGGEEGREVQVTDLRLAWVNRFLGTQRASQDRSARRQERAGLAVPLTSPLVDLPLAQVQPTFYDRGPVVIDLLRRELGDAAFGRFLHGLYDELRFRNATTDAVRAVAERVGGRSLKRFFDAWVRGAAPLPPEDLPLTSRLLPSMGGRGGGMTAPSIGPGPLAPNLNLDLSSVRSDHRGFSLGWQGGQPTWSAGIVQPLYGLGNVAASIGQRPEGYSGGAEVQLAWQPRAGENPSFGLDLGADRRVYPGDDSGAPAVAVNVAHLDGLLETRRVLYGVRPAGGRYRLGVELAPQVLDNPGAYVSPSLELAQHLDLGWFTTLSARTFMATTFGQRDERDGLRLDREGQFRTYGLGAGDSLWAANLELTHPLAGALYAPGVPVPLMLNGLGFFDAGWVGAPTWEAGLGLRLGLFGVGQASVGFDWAPINADFGWQPLTFQFKGGFGF